MLQMAAKGKVGRNAPCPCGSGKKYKKCCLLSTGNPVETKSPLLEEIAQELRKRRLTELKRREKFGEVRPCIHADFDGKKFVAVGSELHYSPKWKTFPDFLMSYIKHILGSDWGNSEIAKPFVQRHEVMKWYDAMCRFQQKQIKASDGTYSAIPNGAMMAYLLLSYDLYTLRHHGALQKTFVLRLKNNDLFQGARHELFAAATCIRAGYEIAYEDETDRTKKHPEFVAKHKSTGQLVSVEAKSRKRPGVLGHPGQKLPDDKIYLRIGRLLTNAFKKAPTYPLVIFLDLNLPPLSKRLFKSLWFDKINRSLECASNNYGGLDPFSLIVLSNQPYYYSDGDSPTPLGDILSIVARNPRIQVAHPGAIRAIHDAANKFGKIPNTFEEAS